MIYLHQRFFFIVISTPLIPHSPLPLPDVPVPCPIPSFPSLVHLSVTRSHVSSVCSSLLSHDEAVTILQALCGAVIETANKNVCTRALWCLAKQTLPVEAVEAEVCTQSLPGSATLGGVQAHKLKLLRLELKKISLCCAQRTCFSFSICVVASACVL